jgi:hypothetical protein
LVFDFRESVHNTNLATFSENKVVVTGFNVNKQATGYKSNSRIIKDLYGRSEIDDALKDLLVNDLY